MLLKVSHIFVCLGKAHRYRAGWTVLFMNSSHGAGAPVDTKMSEDPGRPCLQSAHCLCSYGLWASTSIKGRSYSPHRAVCGFNKTTPVPQLYYPQTSPWKTIHQLPCYILQLSNQPQSHSGKSDFQSCCHKASMFQLYHCEFPFTLNPFLSFAILLSQSGFPCPMGASPTAVTFYGHVGNSALFPAAASRPRTYGCPFALPLKFTPSGSGTFCFNSMTLAPNVWAWCPVSGAHLRGDVPSEPALVLPTSLSASSSAACHTTSPSHTVTLFCVPIHPVSHLVPSLSNHNHNPLSPFHYSSDYLNLAPSPSNS